MSSFLIQPVGPLRAVVAIVPPADDAVSVPQAGLSIPMHLTSGARPAQPLSFGCVGPRMSDQPSWFRYTSRVMWTGTLSIIVAIACAADLPQMMDAIVQRGAGSPDVLRLERLPVPHPRANQVLVHVYAAGVNPYDWRTRMGIRRQDQGGPPDRNEKESISPSSSSHAEVPGSEMAGVIVAVGPGVTQWHVGEAVYGRSARDGDYAQYAVGDSNSIAAKPEHLTFAQAAGIPTAGITALLAVKQAAVRPGGTLVIVGAAGGVGSAALQIAKAQGLRAIAVASSQHNAYLQRLGADEIVNYDKENPADRIRNADAVINMVDGPVPGVLSYVRRGGAIVLPAGVIPREQCASAGVTCDGMDRSSAPSFAESLEELSRLVDAGRFTVEVEKAFPLRQAGQAQELVRAGHVEGKIILITTSAAIHH
jgi:NADPH:quinone reductase-like Zn-dependent oxidoreductase